MPDIYLIGGPNGAGKTTTALRIFPQLGVIHFINADAIAQGLSPLDVAGAARAAGRLMIEQMEARLANDDDFALESTLASRSLAPFIARCKNEGYRFTLIYVWLRDADLAVERVAGRVAMGGHDIPNETIRRRYERGRTNFFELYRPLADEWSVWNNSGKESVEVARGTSATEEIAQPDIWENISNQMQTLAPNTKLDIIAVAFKEAVADAIETHRRMGRSIVVSYGDGVQRIYPHEIAPRALPHDAREAQLSESQTAE